MDDDESIMARITNELDLDSADTRLRALGYTAIFVSPFECKFIRSIGHRVQGMHLQLDKQKHILITRSENGIRDKHIERLQSWDDWIVFVRMQAYRTQILRSKAPEPDKPTAYLV